MQAFLRLLCATAISMALTSAATAEALMLTVADARAASDPRTGRAVVTIKLSLSSAQAFAAFTAARVGSKVELRIDGKVIADPVIREPIKGGMLQIDLGDRQDVAASAIAAQMLKPDAKVEVSAE